MEDDGTFICDGCGGCFFEEEGDGSMCDECLDERCEHCDTELMSVEEEMHGYCDKCYAEVNP